MGIGAEGSTRERVGTDYSCGEWEVRRCLLFEFSVRITVRSRFTLYGRFVGFY